MSLIPRHLIASTLVLALTAATSPTFAAPAAATLTGTVYGDDVKTPFEGATVVVTDVNGVRLASQPTAADGAFTIKSIAPGRSALSLETKDGSFAVSTPVTLAPGELRGVHLAVKSAADASGGGSSAKAGGSGWTGGAIAAASVVLIGFVAAAVVNSDNETASGGTVSPSTPN